MSETYLRQWAMLRHIPRNPRKIEASRVLSRLGEEGYKVSKRTVERDLQSLSLVFPIACDNRDKPYGWSWIGNDIFDIPSMDIPVALTFGLAAQFMQPLMPRSSTKYMDPHFRQAEKVLKNTDKSGQGKWLDKVRVVHKGPRLIPQEVKPEILDTVYEALLTDKRLEMNYRKAGEKKSNQYEVNPLGLVFRDASIYLVANLWDYDETIQLVLHRIISTNLIDKPRTVAKGFNLDNYITSGGFGYKVSDKPIKVKIIFDEDVAIHVQETPVSKDQSEKENDDGSITITATVPDTQELRWWLLGFGSQVEVLQPKSLRAEIKSIADDLSNRYARQ